MTSKSFLSLVMGILVVSASQGWAGTPLDFNGDGCSDLAVYDYNAGRWYIQTTGGTVLAWAMPWGFQGGECVAGDFDGDGVTDMGIYDPRAGAWYIKSLNGTVLAWGLQWGFRTGEAVIADFNNDGKDDLGIYDTQTYLWYVQSVSGEVLIWGAPWGFNGCEPLAGVFEGATPNPLVFDDQTGQFYPFMVSATYSANASEMEPVTGDLNGDGTNEFGAYSAPDGLWFWSWDTGYFGGMETWGFKGGVPLMADYDGDGLSDYAIYDTASGRWYIKSPNGSTLLWNVQCGGRGMVPVGRRMANSAVDNSTLRFADSSATFNITSITVTDLERGTVYRPSASSTLNLLPGWYQISTGWYGSRRSGIINWYRSGTSTKTITVEARRAYTITLSGGSINPPFYTSPSTKCAE